MFAVILLLATIGVASAGCDNACSGHGTCDIKSKCTCYDNWGLGLSHDSGDCSERICPYEFAWVDTPDVLGNHHKYAECAAKGICNRGSGECECFPGYEGKGCQRTICPNDCSGHGQCAYIDNMPFQAVALDYKQGDFLPQDAATFGYKFWDRKKTRGCICDPEYAEIDCSMRMCPYGTDVMDVRDDLLVIAKYQVQKLVFDADLSDSTPGTVSTRLNGKTFALTFKSRLNETFTTIPIVYNAAQNGIRDFVLDIQSALKALPNGVIDDVQVQGMIADGYAGPEFFTATASQKAPYNVVMVNISFTGNNVQGPQHLLTVKKILCADGCTPQLTGLELTPKNQNITEFQVSDYNSFECGRRGKCDYTSGLCQCFAGYTGASCNTITALV